VKRTVNLFCDLYRYVPRGGETRGLERLVRFIGTALVHPGWQAVFILRLSQAFHRVKLYPISWFLYRLNMVLFSLDIPPAVELGRGAWLPHPIGIVMSRDTRIGSEATIYQNVTIGGRGQPAVLGNGVMVGAGACVLGPATLGDKVRVGANSLVTRSFPAGVTIAGVPARRLEELAADLDGTSQDRDAKS
jgi:serine O-acetyltransferase